MAGYSASATFRPFRTVPEMFCCTRDLRQTAKPIAALRLLRRNFQNPLDLKRKTTPHQKGAVLFLAGVAGFEPDKIYRIDGFVMLSLDFRVKFRVKFLFINLIKMCESLFVVFGLFAF